MNAILVRSISSYYYFAVLKKSKAHMTEALNHILTLEIIQKFTNLTFLMLSHIRISYKTTASRSEIYFPTLSVMLVVRARDTHSRYFNVLFLYKNGKDTARKVCLLKLIKLQTFISEKYQATFKFYLLEIIKL